jgi:hypothetical protein
MIYISLHSFNHIKSSAILHRSRRREIYILLIQNGQNRNRWRCRQCVPHASTSPRSFTKVSTDVAQEIIDVLVATNKHEITILTRRVSAPPTSYPKATSNTVHQDPPVEVPITTVKWVKTNYSSVAELTETLRGTHTVLSFIAPHLDQDEAITVQKNLIDASMQAGVQRFAPSEWVSYVFPYMHHRSPITHLHGAELVSTT